MTAPFMLHNTLRQLSSQSATCKVTGVVLAAATLLFAGARISGGSLLGAAAPVALLALVDACYQAKAKRLAEASLKFSGKDGTDASKCWGIVQLQSVSLGFADAGKVLLSFISLSVLPFYAGLAAVVIGLGDSLIVQRQPSFPSGPFAPSFSGQPFNQSPSNPTLNQPNRPAMINGQNTVFPRNPPTPPTSNGQNRPLNGLTQPINPGNPSAKPPVVTPPQSLPSATSPRPPTGSSSPQPPAAPVPPANATTSEDKLK